VEGRREEREGRENVEASFGTEAKKTEEEKKRDEKALDGRGRKMVSYRSKKKKKEANWVTREGGQKHRGEAKERGCR